MAIANSIRSAIQSLATVRLLGSSIHVSKFPPIAGAPEHPSLPPGIYLVDSIVLHESGVTEVGLSDPETKDHLQVFYLEDLQWQRIKGCIARTSSSKPN